MKYYFSAVGPFLLLLIFNGGYSQKNQISPLPTPQHLGPSCQFSVLNYCYGDTTYFINQTIRMMNQSWEITNSSGILFSSVDTNIKFLFPAQGTYSVTLRANNGHPDSLTKMLVIDTTITADFTFQQCTQQFVNMSSCATSFYWDFGDGNFSTNPTPVHFYSDTGSYTVQLIAFNGIASDTLTQGIYVYSKGFPTGSFTYYQSNDTVYFFGDSVADNFNWDFGDTGTSTLKNPAHAFADTGDYTVSHIVNNYCGLGLNFQTIHVFPPANVSNFHGYNYWNLVITPNPFKEYTIITFNTTRTINSELIVTDVFGREVFTQTISSVDSFVLPRGNLPGGIYLTRIISKGRTIAYKKMVIQ